jgi:hypothetical protein
VIFLTKTDKMLRVTDVHYMEAKFIKIANDSGTDDMDNRIEGMQNGYI